MTIEVVPFTSESYDSVLTLWQQCEGVGLSEADSRKNIAAYLERNPGMSFVALANGAIVGAVLAGHDGRRGYLHHLAMVPYCRRQGIARRLVDCCLSAMADAGIGKCHIFIFNSNAGGIAFWGAAGWTPRSDIQVISKTLNTAAGTNDG